MSSDSGRFSEVRIAILGGGIGGFASAAFMHRVGLTATVFEQSPRLEVVGAGLVVSPNAARLLRRLADVDGFFSKAVPLDVGWEFRRWKNGTVLSAERLTNRCEELYGEGTYVAHRADLLDAIKASIPPGWLVLGKRCVAIQRRDRGARMVFDDGAIVDANVLIGADGIHSVVRNTLTGSDVARPSGICVYRAVAPLRNVPEFARTNAPNLMDRARSTPCALSHFRWRRSEYRCVRAYHGVQ